MSTWPYPKYTDEGDYIGNMDDILDGPCNFCEENEGMTCKLDVMERTVENCACRRVEKWLSGWKSKEIEKMRNIDHSPVGPYADGSKLK